MSHSSLLTAWVRIRARACEKVASDLGLGGGFRRVLRFPPLLTNSHELVTFGINVTKNEIQNLALFNKLHSGSAVCINMANRYHG